MVICGDSLGLVPAIGMNFVLLVFLRLTAELILLQLLVQTGVTHLRLNRPEEVIEVVQYGSCSRNCLMIMLVQAHPMLST